MAKRKGGFKRKTRATLKKGYRRKGKISVSRFLQRFNPGDRVILSAEPSYQKGFYFTRFFGRYGTIKAKRGRCYEIVINDFNKEKILIVHPVHLKRV